MSFADNLMELRKLNNLSQEEIAEKIGVSRQTLSKYETGESLPDIERCKMLADLFGVSMDDLISYEKNDSDNLGYAIPPKQSPVNAITADIRRRIPARSGRSPPRIVPAITVPIVMSMESPPKISDILVSDAIRSSAKLYFFFFPLGIFIIILLPVYEIFRHHRIFRISERDASPSFSI